MFNRIVTTCDRYASDVRSHGLIVRNAGDVKECQRIVAIGDIVKGLSIGDLVMLDFTRYAVKKHVEGSLRDGVITDNPVVSVNFPSLMLDGVPHLLLTDQDVKYVIEDFDEVEVRPYGDGQVEIPDGVVVA